MSFSTGSDFVLLSNTVSFKNNHFQLKLKLLKYHSDLQKFSRTQCTPNTLTSRCAFKNSFQFFFVCFCFFFIFLFLFFDFFFRYHHSQHCKYHKTKAANIVTELRVKKISLEPDTQLLAKLVAILLQMKPGHALGQTMTDVTL